MEIKIDIGDHFWALLDDELVVAMKDEDENIYVCGGWECPIYEDRLTVIEFINKPKDHINTKLYYVDK